ncbi:MAG: hypothetical protein ACM3MG_04005 [Bacillota bacterium]
MKFITLALLFVVSTSAFAMDQFPKGPDASITPGALCTTPDSHRYPEQISYCDRNVDSSTKRARFEAYDQLGYRTLSMNRQDFKIDHYIPLCMGGANDTTNLWPQHKSVYSITDGLEALLCEKMAEGKLLQKDAVQMIMEAKNHLDEVPGIIAKANAL